MGSRTRTPLVFGEGLDRETGAMAVDPARFEDLRNVFNHEGKVVVRTGFTARGNFPEVDRIIAGHGLKSERIGIVVGYSSSTQRVYVYRSSADGTLTELLGEWVHDLGGWGTTTPKVIMAESYGRVFLAHDEPIITRRAQTLYYDPIFSAQALNLLESDLDGTGLKPVRFRGVGRHLNYLFGWGFGSSASNRPELVRVSQPGEPTVFDPNAYFIAGDQRDPVLACGQAGSVFLVWKETETHVITGYDRRTFGIRILDPKYGLVSSRGWLNFTGVAVGWTAEGPRVWTGDGESDGIELPLDLEGFEPADLVAEGVAEDAFALYVPVERVLLFVFGRRVYALTLRVPGRWRWSYMELGFDPYCGFILVGGSDLTAPPVGFPEWTSASVAGSYVDITVTNVLQEGDEILEVWLDPGGTGYVLKASVPVSPSSTQVVRITGLLAATAYEGSLRYRRGTQVAAPYSSADPSTWPAVSRGTFLTGSGGAVDPPALTNCSWSRLNAGAEQIWLEITPAAGEEGKDVKIYRDDVLIATEVAPTGPFNYFDTGVTGETDHVYELTTVDTGGFESPRSDPVTCYAGPATPPVFWAIGKGSIADGYGYEVSWTDNSGFTLETEIHDDYDTPTQTGGQPFPHTLRGTVAATVQSFDAGKTVATGYGQGTFVIGVRHKKTTFGVDDFSKFSQIQVTTP